MSDHISDNSFDDDSSNRQEVDYEDENIIDNDNVDEYNEGEDTADTADKDAEIDQDVALTAEDMRNCLTLLCKTSDGLDHAYVRLDARERKLTDIGILTSYVHLRYVDLSQNNLRDVTVLNSLPNLLTINLDNNKLSSAAVPCDLPHLVVASFSGNRIQSMNGISHQHLETLILNHNEVRVPSGLEPDRLSRLHTLELRGNRLTSLAGLNIPTLKNLFLASNEITTLDGVDQLTSLSVLHLRENQLDSLSGFSNKLKYLMNINLRANRIADFNKCKALAELPALKKLVLSENPFSEEDDYRLDVLVELGTLETLDKYPCTPDELEYAAAISLSRRQQAAANQSNNAERKNGDDVTGIAPAEE